MTNHLAEWAREAERIANGICCDFIEHVDNDHHKDPRFNLKHAIAKALLKQRDEIINECAEIAMKFIPYMEYLDVITESNLKQAEVTSKAIRQLKVQSQLKSKQEKST